MIEITTEKGTAQAYLALPPGGTGPGILLLHAWWGLNSLFLEMADRLAGEGFVVLAPDLNFGEVVTTVADAEALSQRRDEDRTAQTAFAACDLLASHPAVSSSKIGCLGFSFGAAYAILLANHRPNHVAAVTLYYGSWPTDFTNARAAFLGNFAENDEWEPADVVHATQQNIQAAGGEASFHFYPGVSHWFAESDRPEYNAEAADMAWQRTVAFFRQHVGKGGS